MATTTLGILYGGRSGEHEVSLQSATSVVRNVDATRFALKLIGITRDGRWFLQPDSVIAAARNGNPIERVLEGARQGVQCRPGGGLVVGSKTVALDCVFPVLHGSFGEDGTVQGLLELADLPYVGAGVLSSALAMDKEIMKRTWQAHGLPVVPFCRVTAAEYRTAGAEVLESQLHDAIGEGPYFVKPACAGSSVGITKISRAEELDGALQAAFRYDIKALVEPAIPAREIEVAVLGNQEPHAFTPGEVVPTHAFYDYEAKYIDPNGAHLVIPAEFPNETLTKSRELAVGAFRAADVCGFARVDIFFDKANEELLLNELNTIPGFTRISMFPRMCQHDGLEYPQLLSRLIDLALERYAERQALDGVWGR